MKIGFSFGRCVRDIVIGTVDARDVLVIICATQIEDTSHIEPVIDAYLHRSDYLEGLDRDQCLDVATQLWFSGKLHQPRNFGARPYQARNHQIWADVLPSVVSKNTSVLEAWSTYRMLLNLVEDVPEGVK